MINALQQVKNDIKSVFESNGITVTTGMTGYANYIMNINSKKPITIGFGYSGFEVFDCPNLYPETCQEMFRYCQELTSVTLFDTSIATSMNGMFRLCRKITSVPQFNTVKVRDMSYMFDGCSSLQTVPQFNTVNVRDMSYMFQNCVSLTTVPQFDTSSVTTMQRMFYDCSSLTTVPQFDTSKVTSFNSTFYNCTSLTSIPLLDAGKVTIAYNMLVNCSALTTIGGFKDFGKVSSLTGNGITLAYCPNITRESIVNIFNNLYDRATAGYSIQPITIGSSNVSKITEDDIAIATNKGWRISN